VVHEEPIPWVRPALLRASFQDPKLASGPKGKHVLYGLEDDTWKRIVPDTEIDAYLRSELLSADSTMPLSRDSAHYWLMKHTIGISRRRAYGFLEQQSALQVSRNIPNERRKGGKPISTRGDVEIDLIEGQGRDVTKHTGKMMDGWYWLACVDRLTGFGVVEQVQTAKGASTKESRWVAVALKDALKRLEHALGTKVHTISADAGSEFMSHVRKMLVARGIKQRTVARGSRVEKYNQDFQRTFYRLLRLKRGSFSQVEQQAEDITNNLRSKYTKLSPADAVQKTDAELSVLFNAGRQPKKPYAAPEPKVGDKCRVLLKQRKNMRPTLTIKGQSRMYKSYHGRHFAKGTHVITKRMQVNKKLTDSDANLRPVYRYYANGRWLDRDEILLISGVDAATEAALRKK